MIATDIFLMQQLILNSSSPSYMSTTVQDQTNSSYQLHPNETVMFIEVDELHLDGSTDPKKINAAYIKYMETTKFFLTDMETYKTTEEYVEATKITMFDDNHLFVSNQVQDIMWKLHR